LCMRRYLSLLRGINVGGQKKISMDQLKQAYSDLGFRKIRTYLQSGNVAFEDPTEGDSESVRLRIEKQIKDKFGFHVLVLLRTKEELRRIVERNPFRNKDGTKLHITFLLDKPSKKVPVMDLDAAKRGDEEYQISGKVVYLFCPNGYGTTKLSNNFLERKLGVPATTRNWRTVNELVSTLFD
jgi:uncharacterized protein (DUF1697 family)